MLVVMLILIVGYIWIWKKGALWWVEKRRRSSLVVRRSRESAGIISEHQSNNLQDTIRRRDVRGQPLDQRQSLVSYARCGDAPAGVADEAAVLWQQRGEHQHLASRVCAHLNRDHL